MYGLGHTGGGLSDFYDDAEQTVSGWDWHEWALAAAGVYFVAKVLTAGAKRGARKVSEPFKRAAKGRKRVAEARRRLHEAEEESGFLGGLFG